MAKITLKGNPIETSGNLPKKGQKVPDFTLVNPKLEEVPLQKFSGKKKVLNIFVSVDTDVCAASVRKFNEQCSKMKDLVVLNISMDLPFAAGRFCAAEGLKDVETLSAYRSSFPKDYGVVITTGPLKGLCSRAIVVLDENNKVLHAEQVPEITQEPSYEKALAALK